MFHSRSLILYSLNFYIFFFCHLFVLLPYLFFFFFFTDTAPPEISPLSLHDPLPISPRGLPVFDSPIVPAGVVPGPPPPTLPLEVDAALLRTRTNSLRTLAENTDGIALVNSMPSVLDRKSTRLNSSHSQISYAVFCLK